MIRVELPDKGITVDFPDDMPMPEMQTAIEQEFYGIHRPTPEEAAPAEAFPTKPHPEAGFVSPKEPMGPDYNLTPRDVGKAQVQLEARKQGVPEADFREQGGVQRMEELGNSFISGAMGTGEGLLGSMEWLTGSEPAKDLADKAARWAEEHAPADPTFTDQVAAGFGSLGTFFIPGMGVAKGAGAIAKVAPKVATWAGIGAASVLEAGTEAGISYRESLKNTGDEEKSSSAATKTFWANMALIPITNKLGVFGEKGKAVRQSIMSALMEGTQEGAQEVISSVALEQGLDPKNILTSAAVGAITGAGVTAAGHAMPQPAAYPQDVPPPGPPSPTPEPDLGQAPPPGGEQQEQPPPPPPPPGPEPEPDPGMGQPPPPPPPGPEPQATPVVDPGQEMLVGLEPTVTERVDEEVPGLKERTLQVIEREFGVGSPEAEMQRQALGLPPAPVALEPPQRPEVAPKIAEPQELIPEPTPRGDQVGPMVNGVLLPSARKEPVSPTEVSPHEIRQLTPEWAFNDKADEPWNKEAPPPKAKEPWEITQKEAIAAELKKIEGKTDDPAIIKANEVGAANQHYVAVRKAYRAGKPVSDEVMKDYPEIREEFAKKAKPPKTAKETPPPGTPKQKTVKGDPIPAGEITPKKQKTYLLDAIDNAIREAPQGLTSEIVYKEVGDQVKQKVIDLEKTPSVRIKVPGDGVFTVLNSVNNLRDFREKVKKDFPAVAAREPSVDMGPTTKQAPRRIAETLRADIDVDLEYVSVYIPRKFASMYPREDTKNVGEGKVEVTSEPYFLENDEYISNGMYLVLKPEGFKRPKSDKKAETRPLPDAVQDILDVKNAEKAEIVAEYSKGKPPSLVLIEQGKKSAALNAGFVDIIKGLHPDAEPYMGDSKAVVWKVDGKTVGVVMPRKEGAFPDLLNEWLEENRKPQPETPKGKRPTKKGKKTPSGQADMGGYASVGEHGPADTGPAGTTPPQPLSMDLPELVELARLMGQGKFPQVLKRLQIRNALGVFHPTAGGKIQLLAKIFKDTEQAAKTLAHEIGHWIDYLPEGTMKRGNILGRIASLKNHAKHIIWPENSPGPLTDEDKKRLRKEAERLIASVQDENWIDEEIERVIGLKPEDVLAIWNDMDFDKILNKELYEYIAGLNAAEKRSIITAALKGQVHSQLSRFATKIKEKTGRKVKARVEAPAESIRMKYEALIVEEIKKRHIYNTRDIYEELKRFTMKWKPFDIRNTPAAQIKYRYSGVELYADALSALLTNPYYLRMEAPNFYEAFFDFVENKAHILRLWNQIQADIRLGLTNDKLSQRVLEGFGLREEEYQKSLQARFKRILSSEGWAVAFLERYYGLTRRVKKVGKSNIPAAINPKWKTEVLTYTGSEHEAYLNATENLVLKPLMKAGMGPEELGFYMFMKRVATERAEFANPYGATQERALEILDTMNPDSKATLEKARQAFYKIRKDILLDKIAESNPYAPDLMKTIADATDYATFDIVGHLEENYGGDASIRIWRQIGTLSPTGNPFTATIKKDMSLMTAVNKNIAAKTTVGFLDEHFPDQVKEPKRKWNGMFHEMQPSRDEETGLIVYMEAGELKGRYVPSYIAEAFHNNPAEAQAIANAYRLITEVLRTTLSPFRTIFVEANPGFWAFNMQRDYRRLARDLPKANMLNMAKYYYRAFPMSFRRVFGKYDETIQEILRGNMLISVANYRGELKEDTQLERMMARYHMQPKRFESKILRPFERFWYYWSGLARGLETVPKVAGHLYLKDRFPDMPPEERAHIVRVRAGSPDFMGGGSAAGLYNNVYMFSKAAAQGWRGDVEAARENPAEFAWKVTKYNLLPKLTMLAIAYGLAGWKWKELMDKATEYDKTNYIIVPLGETPQGKAVYMRVPQDETGRFIGGTVWKLLNHEETHKGMNIFDYTAGQAPGLHPLLGVLAATISYMSGNNPYDHFRGRNAIPEQVFEAGGYRSHKAFAKWMWSQSGGSLFYKFKYDDPNRVTTDLEQLLGYPIASNVIGRFLKVTDYGKREQIRADKGRVESLEAKQAIVAREATQKIIDGEDLSKEEFVAFVSREGVVDNYTLRAFASKFGNVYLEEYMSATSKAQKMAVLGRLRKDLAARKD